MFNLARTFSLFGITGLGVATPIVYEGVTSPHFETLWRKKLNSDVLIGKCSTGEDEGWEYDYEIYLSLDGEEQFDKGLGLKIFAVASSDVIWDGKEAVKERIYTGWTLRSNSRGGIEFVMNQAGKEGSTVKWNGDHCWISNIQKTDGRYSQDNNIVEIKAEDIKLECNEASKKKGFGWVECDLVFTAGNNLKWKEGFKPKLTFSAF